MANYWKHIGFKEEYGIIETVQAIRGGKNSDNVDTIKIRDLEFGQGKAGQPQRIEAVKLDNPLAFQPGTTGLDRLNEHELKELDDAVIRPRCHKEVFVSAAGFVTPLPYNYWRLKALGKACH